MSQSRVRQALTATKKRYLPKVLAKISESQSRVRQALTATKVY